MSKSIVGSLVPVVLGAGIGVGFAYWLVFSGPEHSLPATTVHQAKVETPAPPKLAPPPQPVVPAPQAVETKPTPPPAAPAPAKKAPAPKSEATAMAPVELPPLDLSPGVTLSPPPAIPEPPKAAEPVKAAPAAPVVAQTPPPAPRAAAPVTRAAPAARQPFAPPAPAYAAPARPQQAPAASGQTACSQLPWQTGPAMEEFMRCQWRQQCLNQVASARRMLEQGKASCNQSSTNVQACLQYYDSLDRRYNASSCDVPQQRAGAAAPAAAPQRPVGGPI